jgi:hypothetical protein
MQAQRTEQTPNGFATYHSADFRTYQAKTYRNSDGKLIDLQLCEELDPESGRWEAFVSIAAEETTE